MQSLFTLLYAAVLTFAASAQAANSVLSAGHTDLSVRYLSTSKSLELYIVQEVGGDEEPPPGVDPLEPAEVEYAAAETILQVRPEGVQRTPGSAKFQFLGRKDAALWVLPQVPRDSLLLLGLSGERLEAGAVAEDQVRVRLKAFKGPGDFFMYHVDGFGNPTVVFNSRDGVGPDEGATFAVGGHQDYNFGFNNPGRYTVTLQAEAKAANGDAVLSPLTDFTFEVLPAAVVSTGHTDIGVAPSGAGFRSFVAQDEAGPEYPANAALLLVKPESKTVIPSDASYAFLGGAGESIWVLPETEKEGVLALGFGGEDIPKGAFLNDEVTITLSEVAGAGDFFAYSVDGFGKPLVHFNSKDGTSQQDQIKLKAGGDLHVNWAFTKPGEFWVELDLHGEQILIPASAGAPAVTKAVDGRATCRFLVQQPPHRLASEHSDLFVTFDPARPNTFELGAKDEDHQVLYGSEEVRLVVNEEARLTVPEGIDFLEAGSDVWVLPQGQTPGLLYLGLSAESLPNFLAGKLSVALKSVQGPGDFLLWQATEFGGFAVHMNSKDGIDLSDRLQLGRVHQHFNWGFTAPGIYHVTLEAAGIRADNAVEVTTGNITFVFEVLPLPEPTGFEAWQLAHFPADAADSVKGRDADPDQDGLPNVVEYVMGLDPRTASRANLARFTTIEDLGEIYGAVVYQRVKNVDDLDFIVEASDSLTAPSWQLLPRIVRTEDNGETVSFYIRDTQPFGATPTRFYRLKLVPIPGK